MLQNEYEPENSNYTEYRCVTNLDALRPKHDIACRMCRLPIITNSHAQPDVFGRHECDELRPYYNSSPPSSRGTNTTTLWANKLAYAESLEKTTVENVTNERNKIFPVKTSKLENHNFAPPQGMDAGEYPQKLFHQYYPNHNEGYTFDLLPLPFLDKMKYREILTQSFDNDDVQEQWQEFLNNLPNSESQSITYPDNRFWRWNKYLRYAPDKNRKKFRYTMQVGPKCDNTGRLPIVGEQLQMFREIKFTANSSVNRYARKVMKQG